jgi:hypothetical protein
MSLREDEMKQPYAKPTLTDLSLPTARAGRLPGEGASPQALCVSGDTPGMVGPGGSCTAGLTVGTRDNCSAGGGANGCFAGTSPG